MFGERMKNRLNPAKRDILRKKLERTASFPKKLRLGISSRRLILPLHSLRAAPAGAASIPLLWLPKNQEVQFGALCLKMREPFLNGKPTPTMEAAPPPLADARQPAKKFSLHFFICARLIFSSKRKRKLFCWLPLLTERAAGLLRSGAAEFPPHPPSAAPSLGRTEFLAEL